MRISTQKIPCSGPPEQDQMGVQAADRKRVFVIYQIDSRLKTKISPCSQGILALGPLFAGMTSVDGCQASRHPASPWESGAYRSKTPTESEQGASVLSQKY